ncbi:MAG: Phosphoenolpyruvate carboxykinase (ATP) [Firmicutes bacterium ADurb.Bin456]|nr:MAG: Phosphoenolpyruvate carboxykinase (ATP) [Firmicutes bacterium ADurb.Bin456]
MHHPFYKTVQASRLFVNPSVSELREMARAGERTTRYGSASYITRVRSRSAKNTFVLDGDYLGVDQCGMPLAKEREMASKVQEYLKNREVICLDRQMGKQHCFNLNCRLYITKEFARIPYMWHNMLFEPDPAKTEPDLVSIHVPEWPERLVFVHPEAGVTYILGTDYFGEDKKSFLRMALYFWKKRGGIGFHAGSKVLRVRTVKGDLEDVGFIMFGLSGTGKTTLTIHDHGLQGEERVIIRQDDMVMMDEKGYCCGTENGFYIKTEGLDQSQRVLYDAATSPNAILENVKVLDDGTVLFDNTELTTNGRGVILRSEVTGTDDRIDLEKANKIIFITRRDDIIPPVAKLNAEQAAAYFMLGESIETSAGDPTRAGESKREVGTNPFMIGRESLEGNRLLRILKKNPDMECYLLNTGSVGKGGIKPGKKVSIKVSTGIMKHIAKGTIRWAVDPDWGYEVPLEIPEIDLSDYNPVEYFSKDEYRRRVDRLRQERIRWLNKYPGLNEEIIKTIQEPPKTL